LFLFQFKAIKKSRLPLDALLSSFPSIKEECQFFGTVFTQNRSAGGLRDSGNQTKEEPIYEIEERF
jgi:hypothetical protein